jgi:hypothetical protein
MHEPDATLHVGTGKDLRRLEVTSKAGEVGDVARLAHGGLLFAVEARL